MPNVKSLFVKRADMKKWAEYRKTHPAACLVSEYDLGYRGMLWIRWGWLICRFQMWWLSYKINHPWAFGLGWKLHKIRFKTYFIGHKMMLKDRLTGKTKEVGYLA